MCDQTVQQSDVPTDEREALIADFTAHCQSEGLTAILISQPEHLIRRNVLGNANGVLNAEIQAIIDQGAACVSAGEACSQNGGFS